jgi:hypothetical protein
MKAVVVALAFLSGGPASAFQLGSPKLLAGRGVALARLKSRSSRGGGDEGEGDSSRMADRVRQAQSEQEAAQDTPGWQDVALAADPEALKAQEARARQATLDARAAGFDPDDEDAMKQWRREVAQQARDRMAANAATFVPRAAIVREAEASHLEAPSPRFANRAPEQYTPYDQDDDAAGGGSSSGGGGSGDEPAPVWSGGGDQRDQKQNVRHCAGAVSWCLWGCALPAECMHASSWCSLSTLRFSLSSPPLLSLSLSLFLSRSLASRRSSGGCS